ncbi:Succinyl-CoA--L-malate CoA-transferase beta subunit [bacterium HR23]|nr:Succinyl-CoA--L-malate CoA-transferase beta subunit [bacterium HR23]
MENHGAPTLPLQGVRILSVEDYLQLPWCTVILADMGAEVIRVESLARVETRTMGPYPDNRPGQRFWDQGGIHHLWNRNKRSLTLDLTKPQGVDASKRLVAISDVVAENNRAGVMERFGLDYEALRQVKPDIIMLRTTGYGQTGAWRRYGAFARTVDAVTGLSHLTGYKGGPPVRANPSYMDITAAWNNALVILMALHYRRRTGKGVFIDMSMYETGISCIGVALLEYQTSGTYPPRMGNAHRWMVPHGCYPCAGQDEWVTIAVRTEEEWKRLCQVMGRPDLLEDPRFATYEARWANQDALDALIARWTRTLDKRTVMLRLQEQGIPSASVFHAKDLLTDPHFRQRGFFERYTHPPEVEGVGTRVYTVRPYQFSRSRGSIRFIARLGEHNRPVLADLLGYSPEAIAEMELAGVIGTEPVDAERLRPRPSPPEAQVRLGSSAFWDPDYRKVLALEEQQEGGAHDAQA